MKKLYIFLLAGTLLLTVSACGKKADPTVSPGPETAPVWTIPPQAPVTELPVAPSEAVKEATSAAPVATPSPDPTEPSATETPEAASEETPGPTERPAEFMPLVLKEVTLLQPVLAYPDREGAPYTIPAGTKLLTALEADGEWWFAADGNENVELRLDAEGGFRVETPDGWLYTWVAIDGLDYTK